MAGLQLGRCGRQNTRGPSPNPKEELEASSSPVLRGGGSEDIQREGRASNFSFNGEVSTGATWTPFPGRPRAMSTNSPDTWTPEGQTGPRACSRAAPA